MTPIWEQLFRNGQLTWKTSAEHKTMLERYYAFYKDTAEVQIFKDFYPEFLEEMSVAKEEPEATEEVTEEAPKKKRRKKSSPDA